MQTVPIRKLSVALIPGLWLVACSDIGTPALGQSSHAEPTAADESGSADTPSSVDEPPPTSSTPSSPGVAGDATLPPDSPETEPMGTGAMMDSASVPPDIGKASLTDWLGLQFEDDPLAREAYIAEMLTGALFCQCLLGSGDNNRDLLECGMEESFWNKRWTETTVSCVRNRLGPSLDTHFQCVSDASEKTRECVREVRAQGFCEVGPLDKLFECPRFASVCPRTSEVYSQMNECAHQLQCEDGSESIGYRCDGNANCTDGSDERSCGYDQGPFQCDNATLIAPWVVCDGNADCVSGADEVNCDQFKVPAMPVKLSLLRRQQWHVRRERYRMTGDSARVPELEGIREAIMHDWLSSLQHALGLFDGFCTTQGCFPSYVQILTERLEKAGYPEPRLGWWPGTALTSSWSTEGRYSGSGIGFWVREAEPFRSWLMKRRELSDTLSAAPELPNWNLELAALLEDWATLVPWRSTEHNQSGMMPGGDNRVPNYKARCTAQGCELSFTDAAATFRWFDDLVSGNLTTSSQRMYLGLAKDTRGVRWWLDLAVLPGG